MSWLSCYASVLTKEFIFSDWRWIHQCYLHLYESNMLITFSSMATNHQDWHPIRLHCFVKQYEMCPQVLFKTKTENVLFLRRKKTQSVECTQTIAHITFRKENTTKITSKNTGEFISVNDSKNSTVFFYYVRCFWPL